MTYEVKNGIIHSERGIPECPRWFSDSRLSFQMDENAITQVDYFNPTAYRGNHTLFLQRLWDGFRIFVQEDLTTLKLAHENARIWPFGVESECEAAGARLRQRVLAVEESIVFQLSTPAELPPNLKFKLEFYKDFGLQPADSQDFRFSGRGAQRSWEPWSYDGERNALFGAFTDDWSGHVEHRDESEVNNYAVAQKKDRESADFHIGITADFPLAFTVRPHNSKFILIGDEPLQPNRTYSFVICFAPAKDALIGKLKPLVDGIEGAVAKQFERYRRVSEASPVLISPYKELNDFMVLTPMYHESCKVTDVPGAIKAKNTMYWVWGWDGITSNYSSFYWGDHAFMRDMLRFYDETADPELGVAHSYRYDMALNSVSALPAQSMYVSLLHQYYASTGDLSAVQAHFPFAKRIFNNIKKKEASETGLCEQASLFPDYPIFMHETGHDVSSLNNTIWYCAVRSMEALAGLTGDDETAEMARVTAERIEKHFLSLFYDEERKFIVSSIDAGTLERRNSFNSNAIKWENHYLGELLDPADAEFLDFFEKHIVCKAGLREIPVWSDAFDMDANQLHCWWPVTGEYYMRLINEMNRPDLIKQWIGWVSYWTKKLSCPEGISCYLDTDEPDVDRWNSQMGAWHAYSMRGWYQAAVHGVVGVGMEAGGITFYPYSGEEMALKGMHHQNKTFDVEMKGSGPFVGAIEIGGVTLRGTNKLPVDAAGEEGHSTVVVHRVAERPYPVIVKEGYGLELSEYEYEEGAIRARIQGSGTSRLKLSASRAPVVTIDGAPVEAAFDETKEEAIVKLRLSAGQPAKLEIR